MRSIKEIICFAENNGLCLHDAVLLMDSETTGVSADDIRGKISARLTDMGRSVIEARGNKVPCKLVSPTGGALREYAKKGGLCGGFILSAAAIALEVATYNASMGRIVAAPTAGSCGILPGLLFAWKEFYGTEAEETETSLTEALVVAGAIGEVIANRATLAGAEGGCQAECGAAAAMGAGALVYLQNGSNRAVASAVAITLKSVLGLVCDPVGGLVESPCIKRNGTLAAIGALSADMALAGIESLIPADEVIDAMAQIGRSIPPSLRETSRGGLAVTPTAKKLVEDIQRGPAVSIE
ncbi:MAG: L-serine ammonia-lyase, iron-sulfur-dependent, subunit alpha [Synergistaceae bacterium]|nr:L-serine ammonia-lyase, iron-sulfur-dependent, subunit alpha [Synergistaceae bacterium]